MKLTTNQITTLRRAYSLRFTSYPETLRTDDKPSSFITVTTRDSRGNHTSFKIPCADGFIVRGASTLRVPAVERLEHTFIVNEQPSGPELWRTICYWMRPGDHLALRWSLDEKHIEKGLRRIDLNLAIYRTGARTRSFQLAHVATIIEDAVAGSTITFK